MHVLPGIGDVPLKDLTGKTIDAFYAGRRTEGKRYGGGLSSSTMSNLHRLLALILKSAVKARLLATSPIQDVQTKPKPKRKSIVILHEAELAALLDHLRGGPLYLPALVGAYTGLSRRDMRLALARSRPRQGNPARQPASAEHRRQACVAGPQNGSKPPHHPAACIALDPQGVFGENRNPLRVG